MKKQIISRLAAVNEKFNFAKVSVVTAALVALPAMADGGVDFGAAASDFKTQALAALAAIGIAVLSVAAAVAAFRKGKSLIR